MPEAGGSNIEIAKHLSEHEESDSPGTRYWRSPRPLCSP